MLGLELIFESLYCNAPTFLSLEDPKNEEFLINIYPFVFKPIPHTISCT